MTTVKDALTSAEVCELLGLTYRQLDYAARNTALAKEATGMGHGHPRAWRPETIERLRVAKALYDAIGWRGALAPGASAWTGIVAAVLDGAKPQPETPWVTLNPDGTITYWHGISVHPGLSARWWEVSP